MRTLYLLIVLYIVLMVHPFIAYYNDNKPLFILCAVIMLIIIIGLWYDKKLHDDNCLRNKL